MDNIQLQIAKRLRKEKDRKVFIPKDFLDIGTRPAIDKALSRLAVNGEIQRLGRGLYHVPRTNARLGLTVSPDPDDIAAALARQTGTTIAPSGATAANRLGLSTQVPAKPVYLTNGRSRNVRIGDQTIVVKHVAPKDLPTGSLVSATVFQALRHIGKDDVNPQVIDRIRRNLSPQHRKRLLEDARYTTDWIAETARQIAKAETATEHG